MERHDTRGSTNLGLGLILVGLGITFLTGQLLGINLWRFSWPFFVIVPGLAFFVAMLAIGRSASGLAIPGSIVTTVGLILLYQNSTGHFESWAYIWTLIFPTGVGIGLFIQGAWGGNPHLQRTGERMAEVGIALFLGFALFFEMVIGIGGIGSTPAGRIVMPLLLIALGLYLIVRRTLGWPGEEISGQ